MPDPTPGVYGIHPIPTQCTPIVGSTEGGLHRGGGSRPALVSTAILEKARTFAPLSCQFALDAV